MVLQVNFFSFLYDAEKAKNFDHEDSASFCTTEFS